MNDAYLQIDGIKGESADDRHKEWIEVSNVSWAVHQPQASTVSTSGGLTNERAELSNITFNKLADLSSPTLLQHCATGKTIPRAKFEFMRADGNANPITYFVIELENVMISGVAPTSGEGGIIREHVQLAFSKVKWKYSKQSIKGGFEGNSSGGWDLAGHKVV